jgi:hypothetical protein
VLEIVVVQINNGKYLNHYLKLLKLLNCHPKCYGYMQDKDLRLKCMPGE